MRRPRHRRIDLENASPLYQHDTTICMMNTQKQELERHPATFHNLPFGESAFAKRDLI
jgi:hypothetical protein